MGLFYSRMDAVLGLFGIVLWIVAVIALAAAVTYVVVRISPSNDAAKPKADG
jgi:hypothetical protein